MNKQSNSYTIIYIIVMVLVVGAALATVATALKPEQQKNADADKMRQILMAVHCAPKGNDAITAMFTEHVEGIVVNSSGEEVTGRDAFTVNVSNESREPAGERLLPVFVYSDSEVGTKYILPLYGQGLWGPIWGYIALNDDGTTVYGAYFSHQGETPGLGAEIEKPEFTDQFAGRTLFKDNTLYPIEVVKAGQRPAGNADYVNGISGGTITSKGVGAMLNNCLAPYEKYLSTLKH